MNGNSVDGPVCVYFSYQAASPASVVTNFIDYIKMRGMNADKSAVLARGHASISRLHPGKTSKELTGIKKAAMAVFLWKTSRADCMDEALRCMGSFLSTKAFSGLQWGQQRYYCPHCIPSPLHWRLFVSRLLDACVRNETLAGFDNKWSDWAAEFRSRGKQIIGDCWSELFDESLPDLKLIANAPSNEGAQFVSDCVKEITVKNATLPIRITTIHQVKGETLDSVLLVSAKKQGQGGHWREWLDQAREDGEHSRFAFVGSSRPKHILGWAIPSPSAKDKQDIEALGFVKVDSADAQR